MFNKTYSIQEMIDLELIKIGDGYRAKNSELTNDGLPFARARNLNNGFNFSEADRFPSENIAKVGSKISQPWDCVFTSKGTVGRIALVKDETEQFVYSPQLCYWRSVKHDIIDPVFLYYWMYGYEFKNQIDYLKGQTDMADYVSLRDQKKMKMTIPDWDKQQEIKRCLFAIDNKIELNQQMNQTLEEMAQAIFKSWFVDFEPVKAKVVIREKGGNELAQSLASQAIIAGTATLEQLESMESHPLGWENVLHPLVVKNFEPMGLDYWMPEQLESLAKLFPNNLVESELGEIPEGWEVKKLKDLCRVINGRAYKNTEFKGEGTPIVRIQNLSKRGKTVYSDLELPEDKLINVEDFIYAWSATFGPHIWRGPKSIYHYHIWKMDVDEEIISRYFLYLSMFRKTEQMKSGATGSIFTHLTKAIMESQDILIASPEINMFFKQIIETSFKKISILEKESETLMKLRESLLPKLLSGELSLDSNQVTMEVEQ